MKLNEVIAKYGNQEVDETKIKEVLGVKESKVWKPKFNENYYFVYSDGRVEFLDFNGSNSELRYAMGNCFKTREEAKFASDKQIFLTKFERYLRENEDEPVDWKNSKQYKWSLLFDYDLNKVVIDYGYLVCCQGTINTTNKFALEKFIKDNESDIKKYMFGVE